MSSKPETGPPPPSPVISGGVIECAGRDAGAFLQAQLMNDVRALADGEWQWSGWLTPKGRVVALMALLRFDPERYWLLLPDHPADALATDLQRFVLRSKLRLQVHPELLGVGCLQAPATIASVAAGRRFGGDDRIVQLDFSGETTRTLTLGRANDLPANAGDCGAATWALHDLAHGLPRLSGEPAWTPQMLGLERLAAYSVRKGCYPGQEIVARTHFLGQAKRGLQRLQSAHPLAPGMPVQAAGGRIGEIVCAASDELRHEALALIPLDLPAGELRVGEGAGSEVRVMRFAEGLAR